MKHSYFALICFLFSSVLCMNSYAQCGLYEISLDEKVNESAFIIEGEVVHQQCFKSGLTTKIYTLNTIKVYSVLKGNVANEIFIVTAGGQLFDKMEVASSLLKLNKGQTGLFFLNHGKAEPAIAPKQHYDVFASAQGFYAYNLSEQLVSDVFHQYSNEGNAFYTLLENKYGLNIKQYYDSVKWSNSSLFQRLTIINNFSPASITAGTANEITILGFGFGSSRDTSKVLFKNADDAGLTEIAAEAPQYISWSDTKIVVAVPHKAGTGKIKVVLGSGSAQSNAVLQVSYAISNTGTSAKIYPSRLVARNLNKGYVWHMNVNFDADSVAKSNFLISFKKWRCQTFINWTIGKTTAINLSDSDTLSVITFDELNVLPAGVLGLCYSYYSGCSEDDWYVEEQDMLFRKSDKWHFGDEPIPSNKIDFQSVALHELGHAHQLAHVIKVSDLMHCSLSDGVQKRSIEPSNLEAAQWIMNKSEESDICDRTKMQLLDQDLCNDELFGFYTTLVYPNPFSDFLAIDFYLTKNENLTLNLFDVTGKLIAHFEKEQVQKGFYPVVFNVPNHLISAGLYLLHIETGNEKQVKKLIKN